MVTSDDGNPGVDAYDRLFAEARQAAELSPAEVDALLGRALNSAYWCGIAPGESIDTDGHSLDSDTSHARGLELDSIVERFDEHGYFSMAGVIGAREVLAMASIVDAVRRSGWPAVFAFVYDRCWAAARTPLLQRILEGVLGDGYRQLPNIWANVVSPDGLAAGWAPHVDGELDSGRVSVWIPLTDATLDNGCMVVVPRDRVDDALMTGFATRSEFSAAETSTLLQSGKPLPAPAGSIMGWEYGLIHWGSVCEDGAIPRVSIAFEFVAGDAHIAESELPLIDPRGNFPSFHERLRAIARGVRSYQRFDPTVARLAGFAERLEAALDPLPDTAD